MMMGTNGSNFLELGQEVQAEFALGQDVVQDQESGRSPGNPRQGFAARLDADQLVIWRAPPRRSHIGGRRLR